MIVLTNNERMGKNIFHLRQKHNLSQESFCKQVGIDIPRLDAIETGILVVIDAQILINICRQFEIDLETVMDKTI